MQTRPADPYLSVATRGRCGRWHAELSGELDLASVGPLDEALERTLKDGHRILVLDVSGVTFLGAVGLGALVRAARARKAAGGALTLARPGTTITKVLTLTGLHDLLIDRPPPTCDRSDHPSAHRGHRDEERIASVLAGVVFPVMRWQLLAEATHYGADHRSQIELSRLPEGRYRDLEVVQASLSRMRAQRGGVRNPG